MRDFEERLDPRRVLVGALTISSLVVAVSLAARLLWVYGKLDGYEATANAILNVDAEGNFPTWVATALLVCSGTIAVFVSMLVDGRYTAVWRLFALLVFFVSADEAASIHEKSIDPMRTLLDTGGVLHFAWVILAIPALAVAAFVLRTIFVPLNRAETRYLSFSFVLLVVGAIGGEMASGPFADRPDSVAYILVTHVEEAFEFAGGSFLLFGLLEIMKRHIGDATTSLGNAPDSGLPTERSRASERGSGSAAIP